MSSAREILEQRLAKGEITTTQFDELAGKISASQPKENLSAYSSNNGTTSVKNKNGRLWLYGALAFAGVLFLANSFNSVAGGLSVNGLSAYGNIVSATITNTSGKNGPTALRIKSEDGNVQYCRVAVDLGASTTREIRFRCGNNEIVGRFSGSVVWADSALAQSLPRVD